MSAINSSKSPDISNTDNDISSIFNKVNPKDNIFYRSDFVNKEKNIPNIFITPEFNRSHSVFCPSSVLENEKAIPNIFNADKFQKDSTITSKYADKFFEYPDLFTLQNPYSEYSDLTKKYSNYTDVFNPSDVFSSSNAHNIGNVQHLDLNNRNDVKQEKDNLILNSKLLNEWSSEEVFTDIDTLEVNKLETPEKCLISGQNSEEKMSSALSFWCIVTGANVRDHNIKTYFPQREISSKCIMKDIKLMLINTGTTYFLVDEETQMYKKNGNISISGLTPEMFESAMDPILECSNLYKMICITITKWNEISDNNIVKAFIFAVSNILHDYERTIYAVSNESLLTLMSRLSQITPRLQLLANICCIKTHSCHIPDHVPCGVKLLNQVHNYMFDYRFPRDLFLKMLLYIFESCSLAYFRILSNWVLKGILNDKDTNMFIKLRSDIHDEDSSRQNWDCYIIDESVKVPIFLVKYKKDILNCGKTINFFKKYNDLNVFLPDFTCCFDAIDTQKVYEQFSNYFKYSSGLKTPNCVKSMSNCYLFESVVGPDHQKHNIDDSNDIQNGNDTYVTESTKIYSNNESFELFHVPDWTLNNNTYNYNEPYGFFTDKNDLLIYNGRPFDVINMIDYIPHSLLIPARIQKSVCDKHILDMYFIQENLMGRLYFLSQCFFLMNWQFSSRLCEALFDGIVNNRLKPDNIFNPVKLKSIVDEAILDSFPDNESHNFTLDISFIPHLNGIIDISDVECLDLNYLPEWPMNMILPNKILLKYKRTFLFANKLEYVSWSLFKARELMNVHKNERGLQFRMINLFKHWMNQFVTSIKQYYKQVVIGTCWSELNENFENVQNYDDLYASHKQYMHQMLKRCLMVIGLKDKLILLNKIYIEILNYYQALASGQFYMKNSELLHTDFISMEQSFSRFVKLRELFYNSVLKTVQTQEKNYVVQLESLVTILGPSYNIS